MKILHCCLANFYIDGYGYQENVLPRMHKLQGHDVTILASTETYIENRNLGYVKPSSYFTEDGIPITRLAYVNWIPHAISKKLRIYSGLRAAIDAARPDIVFLHDCQFLSIRQISEYAKRNPDVTIYVDGHTDFGNSAKNWISKWILHGILYKYCAKTIEPFTRKFYGVLPIRVDFFRTMYGIPSEKVKLLVMGAEDSKVNFARKEEIRLMIRTSLGVGESDLVIVTGGKIDDRKKIQNLMHAVREINKREVQLVVFGIPDEQMRREIEDLAQHRSIKYVGWLESEKTYDYFLAADLAVFPGTHSVLWEQAVGSGLPCVFRRWEGIQHIDVGGNCLFLETGSVGEIKTVILQLFQERTLLDEMEKVAMDKGTSEFSYYRIAERAIAH